MYDNGVTAEKEEYSSSCFL